MPAPSMMAMSATLKIPVRSGPIPTFMKSITIQPETNDLASSPQPPVPSLQSPASSPQPPGPQPPPAPLFRGGIDVVRLDVSVVRGGKPVRGLSAADFVVTDEGVQQVVESVEVDQLPGLVGAIRC
jgi:hypothetical protein